MKISDVSEQDGRMCAHLIRAMKIAKYDNLTEKDMEIMVQIKQWINWVALAMAAELKKAPAIQPAPLTEEEKKPLEGFKVKSIKVNPPAPKPKKKK